MDKKVNQKEIELLLSTVQVILTNERLSELIIKRTQKSVSHGAYSYSNEVKNTYKIELTIEE